MTLPDCPALAHAVQLVPKLSVGLLYRFSCGRYVGILEQHARMYEKAGLPSRAAWYKDLSVKREVLPKQTTHAPGQGSEQVQGQTVDSSIQGASEAVDGSVQRVSGNADRSICLARSRVQGR